MLLQLQEIDEIIGKFPESDRRALIDYFLEQAKLRLEDPTPIRRRKISLLRSCLAYIPSKGHGGFVDSVLNTKILQTRALILDLVCTNYSLEKQYIYKPEKWAELIVQDVRETFDLEEDLDLFRIYNAKLCSEILGIFCSCEKFNSAGNQLLLNIVMYRDLLGGLAGYDFDAMLAKLLQRFNSNKSLPIERIESIYREHKETAEKKKTSNK